MEFFRQLSFSLSDINAATWVCLGVAVAAALWLLVVYRGMAVRVSRATESGSNPQAPSGNKPVSVLVYADDNTDTRQLDEMLRRVLTQEYNAGYEVIVINNGSDEDVKDVVTRLQMEHRNLRLTFVPNQAHNLSRKKLGILLGAKAAKHEILLLTCANCLPAGPNWLARMAAPLANGKSVALGSAAIGRLERSRSSFDECATMVGWLSAALSGHPYRGTGYNLAYLREAFFADGGFGKDMNLNGGDDDLFINRVANAANTAVVLGSEARVEVRSTSPGKLWRELRLCHTFTARFLPTRPRLPQALSSWAMWLWLAATVTGVALSLPNTLPLCVLLIVAIGLWWPLCRAWGKTATLLGVKLRKALLPWLMLTRCLTSANLRLRCNTASRHNYTWGGKI